MCTYYFSFEVIILKDKMLNWLLNHNHKVFISSSSVFAFALTLHRKIPYIYLGKVWHECFHCNFLQLTAKRNWAALIPIINSWPGCHRYLHCCPSSQFLFPVICPHFSFWLHLSFSPSGFLLFPSATPDILFSWLTFSSLFLLLFHCYCLSPLCPFL